MDFKVTTWSCSFFGRQGSPELPLAGGVGAMICVECLAHYTKAVDDAPSDGVLVTGGWQEMSNAEMLGKLPDISAEASQVDRFLRQWVSMIRERNISYAEIGKALGVSRQAAWERFSRVVETDPGASARRGSA